MDLGKRLFCGRRHVLGVGHDLEGENVLGSVLGSEDNGLAKCFANCLQFCDRCLQCIPVSHEIFQMFPLVRGKL